MRTRLQLDDALSGARRTGTMLQVAGRAKCGLDKGPKGEAFVVST